MEIRKIYLFSIRLIGTINYKHFFYDIYDKNYVCIDTHYLHEDFYTIYSYITNPNNIYPSDYFSITESVVIDDISVEKYYSFSKADMIEICSNYLLNKVIDKI